ncbi:MAG: hypothetical protein H5T85_08280 [Actinobacteria bacterium]|nr:hypothetical protein [Actinomycetota bacterium]
MSNNVVSWPCIRNLLIAAVKIFLTLLALSFVVACGGLKEKEIPSSSSGSAIPLVSVKEIYKNPDAYRDRVVKIQGYGVIMATFPLPPGYVGMDRRAMFVDMEQNKIVAKVDWEKLGNIDPYDEEHVRTFKGYIRIFSGEIGPPGFVKVETFPYFEITAVD